MNEYRVGERKADNKILVLPVAAGQEIKDRYMIALNADGYAVAASKTADLKVAGMAMQYVDNRNGADGARNVNVYRGCVVMANDGSIKGTDLLKKCYISGSQEVTLNAEGSSVVGTIMELEEDMVAVDLTAQ